MIDEHEFKLDFQQKQVDMKIGMDITWITLKKLVDQIMLKQEIVTLFRLQN